jgi:trehalose synthase
VGTPFVLIEVEVQSNQPGRFRRLIPRDQFSEFREAGRRAAESLRDVTVWNVSSTERGGGVAEMPSPSG